MSVCIVSNIHHMTRQTMEERIQIQAYRMNQNKDVNQQPQCYMCGKNAWK